MRTDVLGVGFDAVTEAEAVSRAMELMRERRGAYVCTPNPEIVSLARKDEALLRAVNGADMVLPDGVGIVWASKRLGRPVPERVAGYDLLMALLARMTGSVYVLGGKPGVAEKAAKSIETRFPYVKAVGWHDGFFADDAEVTAAIRAAAPDLLLVCLGAPRQEKWMAAHRGLPVGLMAGLGGSVDVLAGTPRRAPLWWRRHRIEWIYRLLREPRRIKRQLRLPGFVLAVRRQRVREWRKKED